jgi:hypothetical protein
MADNESNKRDIKKKAAARRSVTVRVATHPDLPDQLFVVADRPGRGVGRALTDAAWACR